MSVTTLEIQKPKPRSLGALDITVAQNDPVKMTKANTTTDKILPVQVGLETRIVRDAPSNQTHFDQDQAPEHDIKTQINMAWDTFSETYIPPEEIAQDTSTTKTQLEVQLDALNTTLSEGIFKAFMRVDTLINNPTPSATQAYKQAQKEISQEINQNHTDPALRNNAPLLNAVEAARNILNPVIRHPELEALVRDNTVKVVDTAQQQTLTPAQDTNINWRNLNISEEIHIEEVAQSAPLPETPSKPQKPSPIQTVRLTLPSEVPEPKGRWGRLVAGVSKLLGRAQPQTPEPKTIEIYAKNDALPARYRNVINEYRKGNTQSAYSISRGIGRENDTSERLHNPEQERQLLREGVNAGQPWAKEFLKIFHEQRAFDKEHRPELRIENALEDHKNGNLTRAYHTALKSNFSEQEKAYLNQPGEEYKQLRSQFAHLVVEAKQAKRSESTLQNTMS